MNFNLSFICLIVPTMQRITRLLIIVVILGSLTRCGPGFENHQLAGKYSGVEWEFRAAKAIVNKANTDVLVFEISNSELTTLCGTHGDGSIISTTCPAEIGTYEFGEPTLRVVTFESSSTSLRISRGAIQLLSIDKSKNIVKARLIAEYDELNYINGYFTANLCYE